MKIEIKRCQNVKGGGGLFVNSTWSTFARHWLRNQTTQTIMRLNVRHRAHVCVCVCWCSMSCCSDKSRDEKMEMSQNVKLNSLFYQSALRRGHRKTFNMEKEFPTLAGIKLTDSVGFLVASDYVIHVHTTITLPITQLPFSSVQFFSFWLAHASTPCRQIPLVLYFLFLDLFSEMG